MHEETMTATVEQVEKTKPSADEMLASKYPERPGTVRRVHRLWAGAWRINWHSLENGYVVASAFVEAKDGGLAERA